MPFPSAPAGASWVHGSLDSLAFRVLVSGYGLRQKRAHLVPRGFSAFRRTVGHTGKEATGTVGTCSKALTC